MPLVLPNTPEYSKYATYEDVVKATPSKHTPILPEEFYEMTPDEIIDIYHHMTPEQQNEFDALLRSAPPCALKPYQRVPLEETWWEVMLLIGGRGIGKTLTGAYATIEHLKMFGKEARVGIGAPTAADARDTVMEGDSGLIKMFPNQFKYYNRTNGEARHIDGGMVKAMGTEKPARWNGGNWSMLWFDELALCNQASWDDANLALRKGKRPYAICTTTPKNRKWVKTLAKAATTFVPQFFDHETGKLRVPTTLDNQDLPQGRVQWLYEKYGKSRVGRQELSGLFIDDVDGAKWKRKWFKYAPDSGKWPRMIRKSVAIDPAGSSKRKIADKNALTEDDRQNQRKNCDTAIAVVGLGEDYNYYLLAVESGQWTPMEWGTKALHLFHKYNCDKIVVEVNYGGAMCESTIRAVNQYDKDLRRQLNGKLVPIKLVRASDGKDIRAQPVSTLYEQGRVYHMMTSFGECEDQMCAFIDAEDNEGADMVDAVVWGFLDLAGMTSDPTSHIIVPQMDDRMSKFITVY